MSQCIEDELRDFVALEARLLDTGRYRDWLTLWVDDGRYWVPLQGDRQADDPAMSSIADEDLLLLRLRVERLYNVNAHSERPPSRCQHVLQASHVEPFEAGDPWIETRTPFLYTEVKGQVATTLTGTAEHRIVRSRDGLRIARKRVDLLQATAALPTIHLFI